MGIETTNKELLRKVNRKIERLEKRLATMKAKNESSKTSGATLTEHAGWNVGYYEGKISVYEDWKYSIEDNIKEEGKVNN